jgi:hypothetical protein
LAASAGRGSDLHRRYRVYLDIVTVAAVPDRYDEPSVDTENRPLMDT